jgi:hypothetical protein
MLKRIPVKCEQSRLNGLLCANDTQGAAAYQSEEGQQIYVGLCSRHGRDLLKAIKAQWLSVEYAETLMNQENNTEDTQTMQAVPNVVESVQAIDIPAPSTEPVNLLAVAEQIAQSQPSNGNGVVHTSIVVEMPANAPSAPIAHVPCEEATQYLALAQTLRDQAKLAPAIAKDILKTAEGLEAKAAKAQAFADKEASKPAPRALDGLPLVRLALLQCGVMDLDVVERAIDLGILSVKKQPAVKKDAAEKTESSDSSTPVIHASSRGHSDEIKDRVLSLKAQGFGDSAIGKEVGLSASTVYSMCKRAAA